LEIPPQYYLKRGYSAKILDEFDVGLCKNPNKPMTGRVVVPVYDNDGKFMVGCSGRAIDDSLPKWKHSHNFSPPNFLYNFWRAKNSIKKTRTAILVEGPGDVWRLEEAGLDNSLALFGCQLHDPQQVILEKSGAMNLVVLLDNDEAGTLGKQYIQKTLSRSYNLFFPNFFAKDVGELSTSQVKEILDPIINNLKDKY
jgi:DNA primase